MMLGRSKELEIAWQRLLDFHQTGYGNVILVQAEGGMGKTRFVQELVAKLQELSKDIQRKRLQREERKMKRVRSFFSFFGSLVLCCLCQSLFILSS
jgi:hypothetical protein